MKKWILPRWGACRLTDIKATAVESWLKKLCFPKTNVSLARGSKAKIRNIMSALYSHAIRWEWTDKNPISSVRQSAKRQKVPVILEPEEIMVILKELPSTPHDDRTGCFHRIAAGRTDWTPMGDVDFENLVLHIRRSVVSMVEGLPKTEASQKEVPLDAQLADSLFRWRQICQYTSPADWVFASPHMKGKQPYWPGTLWRYYGRPALKRAQVQSR